MLLHKLSLVKRINLRIVTRRNFAAEVTKADDVSSRDTIEPSINRQTQPFVNPITPTTPRIKLDMEKQVFRPSSVASFDDIPGPISLYLLSKLWSVIPVAGTEMTAKMIQYILSAGKLFGSVLSWGNPYFQGLFNKFFVVYGPVVRLRGPFGGDLVLLNRPEHARILFSTEVAYPMRANLDCIEKYCLDTKKYRHTGLFIMNGTEWEKGRELLKRPLQDAVVKQADAVDEICDEFLLRIMSIRNGQLEMPATFRDEIYKWSLECLCSTMLNERLGFLDPCGLTRSSDAGVLLNGLKGASDAVQRCELGLHLWKFMETPAWKSLVRNCDSVVSVLDKHIQRSQFCLKTKTEQVKPEDLSLIETMLLKEGVKPEDVLTIVLDMFLVGVNATTHAVAFMLYHLSKSPRCQQNLQDELTKEENTPKERLYKLPYMQACIKEVLRLKPSIPFLTRITNNDVVIHNYAIPKGTHVMVATRISSLKEEHFEDAHKFLPERWLKPELGLINKDLKDFACMPYGYGARECIAKELAEMQIALLISKVLKKFRVEYYYADINSTNKLFALPDKPLRFRFVERM